MKIKYKTEIEKDVEFPFYFKALFRNNKTYYMIRKDEYSYFTVSLDSDYEYSFNTVLSFDCVNNIFKDILNDCNIEIITQEQYNNKYNEVIKKLQEMR